MDRLEEIWKETKPKAIRRAKQRAKDKASMVHGCSLILHGASNFGAIYEGIREQRHWAYLYSVWIHEMDERYGDEQTKDI